jgi:exopolysaccharide biosynthesis protein
MKRYIFLSAIWILSSGAGFSQSDSLTVIHSKWEIKKLAPGIWLKTCSFNKNLFGANQYVSILEIRQGHKNRIDVEADPKLLKTTSQFGQEHDALATLNGTFFDMKNGGSEDYLRIDGTEVNGNKPNKTNARSMHQKAAIVINHRRLMIEAWNHSDHWEQDLRGSDIMVTGPLLLKNSQRVKLDTSSFFTARHPRTAVATKGRVVLFITVDGRNQKASGMSLYELASFLKWMKTDDAINLDGGGSTTLWVKNFEDNGVVNHPSDNKKLEQTKEYKPGMDLDNLPPDVQKWDHTGERKVANVLVVNEKK